MLAIPALELSAISSSSGENALMKVPPMFPLTAKKSAAEVKTPTIDEIYEEAQNSRPCCGPTGISRNDPKIETCL